MADQEPQDENASSQNDTGFNVDADLYSILNIPQSASIKEI